MNGRLLGGLLLAALLLLQGGCSGQKAVEGKTKIDSTEPFKKLKSTKSPPAKAPTK